MSTRASDVVAYIDTTSSFELKFRIEIVGGNRIEIAVTLALCPGIMGSFPPQAQGPISQR